MITGMPSGLVLVLSWAFGMYTRLTATGRHELRVACTCTATSARAWAVNATHPSTPAVARPALRCVTCRTLISVFDQLRSMSFCRFLALARSPSRTALKILRRSRRTRCSCIRQSTCCQASPSNTPGGSSGPFTEVSNVPFGSDIHVRFVVKDDMHARPPPLSARLVRIYRSGARGGLVMSIVGSFDVHRRQITFDYLDTDTDRVYRGRIAPACRGVLRQWLAQRFASRTDVTFAVEACTGWRFVIEELEHAGIQPSLAEPADTAAARGRKRRAKSDAADTALMRGLLAAGRLPTSWIPPEQVRETRAILELYKDLRDEHTAWVQRIHAMLFHQGVPALGTGGVATPAGRAALAAGEGLSAAGRQSVTVALRMLDALDTQLDALHRQIRTFARQQP